MQYAVFLFLCFVSHLDLHSFPTRRSSDLRLALVERLPPQAEEEVEAGAVTEGNRAQIQVDTARRTVEGLRSEEHTSELQSLTNLVCRLLLEKKKKRTRSSAPSAPPPCQRT